ncbi:MAG: YkgJ family cysteine cluster protein [Candidatus Sericytochromatia bacterium]|nr:YkgJ family cysteine cluster protein [Candidatus Tanganyikabacteria bacterium]
MSQPDLSPPYSSTADLYEDVERNLRIVLAAHAAEGIVSSCRPGCDACCHQLVMSTQAEADATAKFVAGLPAAESGELKARLAAWADRTRSWRRRLQDGADGDVEALVETLAAEYWAERVPCPFLVDRRCAVYPARPLACRHHFAVSDPAECERGDAERILRIEALDDAFFLAQDAIPEDQAEIGFFPELVTLSLAD